MSTKIPSPIETAVDEFIKAANVSFSVALVGATKRDDWECDKWRVTIKTARIEFTSEFFTGTGHRVDTVNTRMLRAHLKGCHPNSIAWQNMLKRMKPEAPCAASVLYSLVSDGAAIDQSFTDWCDELGYDTDSRKALQTYEACCESGRKLREVFNHEQRQQLANLLQDY